MQPFLLVGVGGSGGKTLRAIKRNVQNQLKQAGWTGGIPEAWQFLHIDSVATQDGTDFPAPFLNSTEYLSLAGDNLAYGDLYDSLIGSIEASAKLGNERPLPDKAKVLIDVSKGAGAWRAIGRTLAAANLNKIRNRVTQSIAQLTSAQATAQLEALSKLINAGQSQTKTMGVIVFSSIAGGSGAGMYLDVIEAVKAAGAGAPWVHDTTAVLYTPDVFAGVTAPVNLAGNALTAISEYMSSGWRRNPTTATAALYSSQGIAPGSADPKYRMGPKDVYLVGMKNGQGTNFGSQTGVYQAVGVSFTALLMNESVQDNFNAQIKINVRSVTVGDQLKIVEDKDDSGRFSALGFSRLTLGMDRFSEFSSERLAKQAVTTLMKQHLALDPGMVQKTAQQWIDFYSDMYVGKFISDLGLNEVTVSNNQVIDALRPNIGDVKARFRAAVQSFAESGIGANGQSFTEWTSKIVNSYENNLHSALGEVKGLRLPKIRSWVGEIQKSVIRVVLESMSDVGLPVTSEMLRRATAQVIQASQELIEESHKERATVSNVQLLVSQTLGSVATMNAIPVNNPAVAEVYKMISDSAFGWQAESDLKVQAAELLADLAANYLEPLEASLKAMEASLNSGIAAPQLLNGLTNPYPLWPDFATGNVPSKFDPAPNEALLVDVNDYPKIFDGLVNQTIKQVGVPADRAVIKEFILGTYGEDAIAKLSKAESWSLVNVVQEWIPQNVDFRVSSSASNQQASFEFQQDHMEYPEYARKWLLVPSRPFSQYIRQDIVTFLNPTDKSEVPSRQSDFQKAFTKFTSLAAPLVDINLGFLQGQVQPGSTFKSSMIISPIPVAPDSPLYASCQAALQQAGMWTESLSPAWFKANPMIESITIMTSTPRFIQPVAINSLMEPIAQQWEASSALRSGRTDLLKNRRSRPLAEAIPADEASRTKMLQGFFVARLLNQFTLSEADREKDYKASIWADASTAYAAFPYPLMASEMTGTLEEMPGLLLMSLQVALVECYLLKSLDPLKPYNRLKNLGTDKSELENWIVSGKLSVGAPLPLDGNAGSQQDEVKIRQAKCIQFLKEEAQFFSDIWSMCKDKNPRTFPLSWEIKDDIDRAIQEVLNRAQNVALVSSRGFAPSTPQTN